MSEHAVYNSPWAFRPPFIVLRLSVSFSVKMCAAAYCAHMGGQARTCKQQGLKQKSICCRSMRVQLTRCLSTRVPARALNSQCASPSMLRGRPIQVWQALLSLTYGHTVSTYVPGHNLSHHKYTQQPKDVMRTTKLRFNWNLWNGLFFQQSVVSFECCKGVGRFDRFERFETV